MGGTERGGVSFVRTAVKDSVGWIEFDRPPVNAFEWTMVGQVADALDAFEADPEVRVLVLASAVERYFSAGADLETFRDLGEDGMDRWCELVHYIVGKLRGSSKPILAAISGVAVGGGLEMALHCDIRFAARDVRLGQPACRASDPAVEMGAEEVSFRVHRPNLRRAVPRSDRRCRRRAPAGSRAS
jgi:enoyl-CoA hydratase/carnithine racemase